MARKSARWMCTLDDRILEYVEKSILATPSQMENTIRFNASERRIRERCDMLQQAGLIAPITEGGDLYVVTIEGRQYLEGDLDAQHQPRPSVQRASG